MNKPFLLIVALIFLLFLTGCNDYVFPANAIHENTTPTNVMNQKSIDDVVKESIKICSFNAQIFGTSKANDANFMTVFRRAWLLGMSILLIIFTVVMIYLYFKQNKNMQKEGVKSYSTPELIKMILQFANDPSNEQIGWVQPKKPLIGIVNIEHPSHNEVFYIYLRNRLIKNLRGIFYVQKPEQLKILQYPIYCAMNAEEIEKKAIELSRLLKIESSKDAYYEQIKHENEELKIKQAETEKYAV